jgi:hypothetical protein
VGDLSLKLKKLADDLLDRDDVVVSVDSKKWPGESPIHGLVRNAAAVTLSDLRGRLHVLISVGKTDPGTIIRAVKECVREAATK